MVYVLLAWNDCHVYTIPVGEGSRDLMQQKFSSLMLRGYETDYYGYCHHSSETTFMFDSSMVVPRVCPSFPSSFRRTSL